jgi:mannonate dehydratase
MLEKTWRWFGENDPISLKEIKQVGVEGIVTSLHHLPNGAVWDKTEILRVKEQVEEQGFTWSVVESLPVHEQIKHAGPERDELIANYKESLKNLGECGIDTVCYNFMPVIDWIRTSLHYSLESGAESLFFDFVEFVVFDRFLLEREAADKDYPKSIVEQAHARYQEMSEEDKLRLVDTIIVKTQGFIDGISAASPQEAISVFKDLLKKYRGIDEGQLRENLRYFLEAVVPVAEEYDVKLCIHPDDPPMKVLGLPRIVGSQEDIQWIMNAVDSPANGLTFCAGSLSAGAHNELGKMVRHFADRIHFAHLRSTELLANGNFYEASHLGGKADLYTLIVRLLEEQERRTQNGQMRRIPMRVDHGHRLLSDFNANYHPGYPLIGRLKGMAEVCGMEAAICRNLKR